MTCSVAKFGCSIGIFLNFANLICRSMDISKYFRGSLRLRDNESRLYLNNRLQKCLTLLKKWSVTKNWQCQSF